MTTGRLKPTWENHQRRAVEPDGTVHAARSAGGGFTTSCAVYPAPEAERLDFAPDGAVTCGGCLNALNLHLGANLATEIRTAAQALSEIDNITDTGSAREILFDIAHALDNLTGPVAALIDSDVLGDASPDWFIEAMTKAKTALADAAAGIKHASDNI